MAAWLFSAAWMLTVGLYGYRILYDDSGELTWVALPIVFFFGLGVWTGKWALSQPRVRVEILERRVLVQEKFAWFTREDRFAASELSMLEVVEEQDSDGDSYFRCVLKLPDGRALAVAESGSLPRIEAAHQELLAALGRR